VSTRVRNKKRRGRADSGGPRLCVPADPKESSTKYGERVEVGEIPRRMLRRLFLGAGGRIGLTAWRAKHGRQALPRGRRVGFRCASSDALTPGAWDDESSRMTCGSCDG
jgi:hypothetical protein